MLELLLRLKNAKPLDAQLCDLIDNTYAGCIPAQRCAAAPPRPDALLADGQRCAIAAQARAIRLVFCLFVCLFGRSSAIKRKQLPPEQQYTHAHTHTQYTCAHTHARQWLFPPAICGSEGAEGFRWCVSVGLFVCLRAPAGGHSSEGTLCTSC